MRLNSLQLGLAALLMRRSRLALVRHGVAFQTGMRLASGSLVLMLTLSFVGPELHAQTNLAWKFTEGEKLRYRIHHKVDSDTKAVPGGGRVGKSDMDLEVTLAWSVGKLGGDGAFEITQTVEHVREAMKEKSLEGDLLIYDSADPRTINNPWSGLRSEVYRPVLNAPYVLRIDRRGELIDVRLPKDVFDGWNKFSLEPQAGHDFLFTKAGLKELLSIAPRLPEGPLARGGRWSSRQEVTESGIRKTLVETYALAGQEGQLAKFEAKPEITMEMDPELLRQGTTPSGRSAKGTPLAAVKVESQSGETKLSFDLAAGRLTTLTRRLRYVVRYDFKNSDDPSMSRAFEATKVSESDINLIPAVAGR